VKKAPPKKAASKKAPVKPVVTTAPSLRTVPNGSNERLQLYHGKINQYGFQDLFCSVTGTPTKFESFENKSEPFMLQFVPGLAGSPATIGLGTYFNNILAMDYVLSKNAYGNQPIIEIIMNSNASPTKLTKLKVLTQPYNNLLAGTVFSSSVVSWNPTWNQYLVLNPQSLLNHMSGITPSITGPSLSSEMSTGSSDPVNLPGDTTFHGDTNLPGPTTLYGPTTLPGTTNLPGTTSLLEATTTPQSTTKSTTTPQSTTKSTTTPQGTTKSTTTPQGTTKSTTTPQGTTKSTTLPSIPYLSNYDKIFWYGVDKFDCTGNDIPNSQYRITGGIQECADKCNANPSCNVFTVSTDESMCWLKTGCDSKNDLNESRINYTKKVPTTQQQGTTKSTTLPSIPFSSNYNKVTTTTRTGILNFTSFNYNIDCSGNDIPNSQYSITGGIQECADKCNANPSCNAFTVSRDESMCWLKTGCDSKNINQSRISYIKKMGGFQNMQESFTSETPSPSFHPTPTYTTTPIQNFNNTTVPTRSLVEIQTPFVKKPSTPSSSSSTPSESNLWNDFKAFWDYATSPYNISRQPQYSSSPSREGYKEGLDDPTTDPVTSFPGTTPITSFPGTTPITSFPGTTPITSFPGTTAITSFPGTTTTSRTTPSSFSDNNGFDFASPELDKQVFHVSNNLYTYPEAQAVCRAFGGQLATYEQIEEAYAQGADWVQYGWSEGQYAYFPLQVETWKNIQKAIKQNGGVCKNPQLASLRPGISGGYFGNPNLRFGVNCYGVKPPMRNIDRISMDILNLPEGVAPSAATPDPLTDYYSKLKDQIPLDSFNEYQW
jgi:hypothetical protein